MHSFYLLSYLSSQIMKMKCSAKISLVAYFPVIKAFLFESNGKVKKRVLIKSRQCIERNQIVVKPMKLI